jgi:hypothetical protein
MSYRWCNNDITWLITPWLWIYCRYEHVHCPPPPNQSLNLLYNLAETFLDIFLKYYLEIISGSEAEDV